MRGGGVRAELNIQKFATEKGQTFLCLQQKSWDRRETFLFRIVPAATNSNCPFYFSFSFFSFLFFSFLSFPFLSFSFLFFSFLFLFLLFFSFLFFCLSVCFLLSFLLCLFVSFYLSQCLTDIAILRLSTVEEEPLELSNTPQGVYVRSCALVGVAPTSCVLRQLGDATLSLPHHGLGTRGAKALAIALLVRIFCQGFHSFFGRVGWLENLF